MQRTKIRRNRNRNRINSKDNDRDPFDINKISKETNSKKKSPMFDRDTKHRKKSQRIKLKERFILILWNKKRKSNSKLKTASANFHRKIENKLIWLPTNYSRQSKESKIYRLISKDNDQDPFEVNRMSIERESKKRSEKFDRVQTTIEKAKNQPKYKLHLLRIQINWNKVNSKANNGKTFEINEVWIERNSQKKSEKFDKRHDSKQKQS